MRIAVIVLVCAAGVVTTCFAAWRMWRTTRSGGPRELVIGYAALMLAASAASITLLRLV